MTPTPPATPAPTPTPPAAPAPTPPPSLSPQQLEEYQRLKAQQTARDAGFEITGDVARPNKLEAQQQAACSVIQREYAMIRVEDGNLLYYMDPSSPSTYRRASDDFLLPQLVKEAYTRLGIMWDGNKIEKTVKTLKYSIPLQQTVKHIDNTLIEVCPGHFWDTSLQEFTDSPMRPCFVRLFDNGDMPESQSVVTIDFNDIKWGDILVSYRAAKAWLNWEGNKEHTLPNASVVDEYDPDGPEGHSMPCPTNIYFPFIDVWACFNPDTYMDIMKMIASVFMRRKPLGTFILTGVSRNGKGTCAKMIHTLLGRANTSAVRLDELSEKHKNLTLATTLFNAPDEDVETSDMSKVDIANFKSIASNEPILLDVLYSQKPQWVSTDFVSLSPMNASPTWSGTHAMACTKRSLIIGFHANLSKYDNKGGESFEERTFTPETFSALLGTVLALSEYYNTHDLTFSETMTDDREIIAEESTSANQYAETFVQYFKGYVRIKDVYNDYAMWVKKRGGRVEKLKTLRFAIQEAGHGAPKRSYRVVGTHEVVKASFFRESTGDRVFDLNVRIEEAGDRATVGSLLYGSLGPRPDVPYIEFDGAVGSVVSYLAASAEQSDDTPQEWPGWMISRRD